MNHLFHKRVFSTETKKIKKTTKPRKKKESSKYHSYYRLNFEQIEPKTYQDRILRTNVGAKKLDFKDLKIESIGRTGLPATLKHDLDKVLFKKGVHFMHESKFPGYLEDIQQIETLDQSRFGAWTVASRDPELLKRAQKVEGVKFVTSTSSVIPFVKDIYSLFSGGKKYNISELPTFIEKSALLYPPRIFPGMFRLVKLSDKVWAFNNESASADTILSVMGNVLEKYLTEDKAVFDKTFSLGSTIDYQPEAHTYNYIRVGDVLVRSQLDAYHPDVGIFDIKTRASYVVRHNVDKRDIFETSKITTFTGLEDSFEREYHDMIRTCFLKYSLQAKLGEMSGVFVSYHNTLKFFGFEYLTIEEMERAIYQTKEMADVSFQVMFSVFTEVMNTLTELHGDEDQIIIETEGHYADRGTTRWLQLVVKPVSDGKTDDRSKHTTYTLKIRRLIKGAGIAGYLHVPDVNDLEVYYELKKEEKKSTKNELNSLLLKLRSVPEKKVDFTAILDDIFNEKNK